MQTALSRRASLSHHGSGARCAIFPNSAQSKAFQLRLASLERRRYVVFRTQEKPPRPQALRRASRRRRPNSEETPRGRRHALLPVRSEEHTSELQSLMRISYAVFCLTKNHRKSTITKHNPYYTTTLQ